MSLTDNEKRFLIGLEKLTRKTGIEIRGCGCCGSPSLEQCEHPSDPRAGYATEHGDEVEWKVPEDEFTDDRKVQFIVKEDSMVEKAGTGGAENEAFDNVMGVGVGRLTYVREREEKARLEIVKDIVRAKKQLGITGRQRELSFFKDIWPHIFKHLQETNFKLPGEE